ncbi:hypothetical protein [Shimia sp. SDUM112013]|uniref:hypothetical protein n=1 Tax=Shimia sp. SDUM112013 TaxID=3136160 RepID=UPI0032ECEA74
MVAVVSSLEENAFEAAPLPAADEVQPNPLSALKRALRGRWKAGVATAALLGPVLATVGYVTGVELYDSQAILRVYPQETNILYTTGEDSVLKTFDSFVKAETTYVASHPVMERSVQILENQRPDLAEGLKASDMSRSIEIKRSDSLIVLKTRSKDQAFASQKLEAVIAAYLARKAEAEETRTSVRLEELRARETELQDRLAALRSDQLEIGGEFGLNALAKAHIEKIAQIDALSARKSEVAATLAAYEAEDGASSADTSDQEIMRATLLDRAMADLNFERAKLMSELAGLRAGYADQTNLRFQRKVEAKIDEINVIETAMDNRREQIRVLGQTGALTDVTEGGDDTTVDEIKSLYAKVSGQLDIARQEARDLNRRRIELDRVETEIDAAQNLLGETRRALEVIRLEFGRALPGYAVVMSPPSQPLEPSEDTRKMRAAGGLMAGLFIAFALMLYKALTERRLRFAETLVPVENRLPVRQVTEADESDRHAADLLRNDLQMHCLRKPRLVGDAPVIAITNAGEANSSACARALAESFARAHMRTLLIEADITCPADETGGIGWRELLRGAGVKPQAYPQQGKLWHVPAGADTQVDDGTVSAQMVRSALARAARSIDVVIVSAGALGNSLSTQFILSNADVGVLALTPADDRRAVTGLVDRLDSLPRNGSIAVVHRAHATDPWLSVQT